MVCTTPSATRIFHVCVYLYVFLVCTWYSVSYPGAPAMHIRDIGITLRIAYEATVGTLLRCAYPPVDFTIALAK